LYLTKRAGLKQWRRKERRLLNKRRRNKSEVLKRLHVMAKQTKEKEDIIGMPCIRSKDDSLKVTSDEKMKAWKEYLEELLDQENEWSVVLEVTKNEGPCEKVTLEAVLEALRFRKNGKAARPSGVTSDFTENL